MQIDYNNLLYSNNIIGYEMARICSVGFTIPGITEVDILRNQSLDDYDIIFFDPSDIINKLDFSQTVRFSGGETALDESNSNKVNGYLNHWKTEIQLALDAGKTLILISSYNRVITYAIAPRKVHEGWKIINGSIYDICDLSKLSTDYIEGSTIIAKQSCIRDILLPICEHMTYSIIFRDITEIPDMQSVLETTSGRCVGLFGIHGKNNGKILIIPRISFPFSSLALLSDKDKHINKALIKMAVDLHNLKNSECETPPEWVSDDIYKTETEKCLNSQLTAIDTQIAELNQSKVPIEQEKEKELILKQLLFGKGKALENAVNMALNILGIKAEQYRFKNKDLEIDHLADLPSCILIGECEGKDNKDIDKTKISQLLTNKGEYYDEPDINTEKPIKLVLFGNPMRLSKPGARNLDFTKACVDIAKNNQVSLVKTADLFKVVSYVNDSADREFAEKCADAILKNAHGIVAFPIIPHK